MPGKQFTVNLSPYCSPRWPLESILRMTFSTASILLCLYHVTYIVQCYTKYPTGLKVAPLLPVIQKLPRTTLCFPLNALISLNNSNSFFDSDRNSFSPDSTELLINHTSSWLFHRTPSVNELLIKCAFRSFLRGEWFSSSSSPNTCKCSDFVDVTKHLTLGYMCYTINLNFESTRDQQYSYLSVANSMFKRRVLYQLSLSEKFNVKSKILPIVHFARLPFHDRYFNMDIDVTSSSNQSFTLTYNVFQIHKLPPPYDTACTHVDYNACYYNCCIQVYRSYGIHDARPHSSFWPDEDNARVITSNEIYQNISFEDIHRLAYKKCSQLCKNNPCSRNVTVTVNSPPQISDEMLTFSIETTAHPIIVIEAFKSITVSDLIIQLASVLGIWLGSSVIELFKCVHTAVNWFHSPSTKSLMRQLIKGHNNKSSKLKFLHHEMKQIESMGARLIKLLNNLEKISSPRKYHHPTLKRKIRIRCGKSFQLIVKSFFTITICCLFCIQLYILLFQNYFQYKSYMKVKFVLDIIQKPPNLVFCADVTDFLDLPPLNAVTEDDFDRTVEKYDLITQSMSLNEIFKRCPNSNSIINACRIRPSGLGASMINYNSSEICRDKFYVTTFYTNGQMCYKIQLKSNITFKYVRVKRQVTDTGIVYSVSLNLNVTKFYIYHPILFYNKYPFISISLADKAYRSVRSGELRLLSFQQYEFHQLPRPYDTGCIHYNHDIDCIQLCIVRESKKINKLPYGEILYEPSNLTIITYKDLKRQSIAAFWMKSEQFCRIKCKRPNCHTAPTRTFISYSYKSNKPLELAVTTPAFPTLLTRAIPMITFADVLYKLLCMLSFWLGFSFYKSSQFINIIINPITWYFRFISLRRRLRQLHQSLDIYLFIIQKCYSYVRPFLSRKRKSSLRSLCGYNVRRLFKLNKVNSHVYFTLIVIISCSIGCSFHIHEITGLYFRYPTVMSTSTVLEKSFLAYKLTLCFPINNFVSSNWTKLTLKRLIQLTPQPYNILTRCGIRGKSALINDTSNIASDLMLNRLFFSINDPIRCAKLLFSRKYLTYSDTCFTYKLNSSNLRGEYESRFHLNLPKIVMMMSIRDNFTVNQFSATISSGSESISRVLTSNHALKPDVEKSYVISYTAFQEYILPAPYDMGTYCDLRYNICLTKCLADQISLNDKYFDFYSKLDSWTRDDRNVTDTLKMKGQSKCQDKCHSNKYSTRNQNVNYTATHISYPIYNITRNSSSVTFWFRSTDAPITITIFRPQFPLIDLLLYIGSIFSIWFGVAALKLAHFSLGSSASYHVDSVLERVSSLKSTMRVVKWALMAKYLVTRNRFSSSSITTTSPTCQVKRLQEPLGGHFNSPGTTDTTCTMSIHFTGSRSVPRVYI